MFDKVLKISACGLLKKKIRNEDESHLFSGNFELFPDPSEKMSAKRNVKSSLFLHHIKIPRKIRSWLYFFEKKVVSKRKTAWSFLWETETRRTVSNQQVELIRGIDWKPFRKASFEKRHEISFRLISFYASDLFLPRKSIRKPEVFFQKLPVPYQ